MSDKQYSVVMYTDGGAGPTNPGFVGGGFHGYIYDSTVPKTGAGLDSHILTNDGYISKPNTTPSITPIMYLDGVVSLEWGSNNVAELLALTAAIDEVIRMMEGEYIFKKCTFHCDSEYTLKGINEWSPIWIRNNWVKKDGSEVANQEYWKKLLACVGALHLAGVDTEFNHVYGHDDGKDHSFGNNIADYLATIGKTRSLNNWGKPAALIQSHIVASQPTGYWKQETVKNPFLAMRGMCFSTERDTQVPGEYYLTNMDTEVEYYGKRVPDCGYAVVCLKEPNKAIEAIRARQTKIAPDREQFVRISLDTLFDPKVSQSIELYGDDAIFVKPEHPRDLLSVMKKAKLTKVMEPKMIAGRCFDIFHELKTMLLIIADGNIEKLTPTSITEYIYDVTEVVKKGVSQKQVTIKPEHGVGLAAIKVPATVQTTDGPVTIEITLSLGVDIPDRNALKRMESDTINVTVITWVEADNVWRYATVIDNAADRSIWCGYYSNLYYLTEKMVISQATTATKAV